MGVPLSNRKRAVRIPSGDEQDNAAYEEAIEVLRETGIDVQRARAHMAGEKRGRSGSSFESDLTHSTDATHYLFCSSCSLVIPS